MIKQEFILRVCNSPTILNRVIQVVKSKCFPIRTFAAVVCEDNQDGIVNLIVELDNEKIPSLKAKFEKLVDVIHVELGHTMKNKELPDMLLITRKKGNGKCLCFLIGERVYDCHSVHPGLPETGEQFVAHWEKYKPLALLIHNGLVTNTIKNVVDFIEIGEAEDVQALVWPGM